MQLPIFSIVSRTLCIVTVCATLAACGVPPVDVTSSSATTAIASAVTVPTAAATSSVVPTSEPTAEATPEATQTSVVPTVTITPTSEPTVIVIEPTPTDASTVVTPTLTPATVDTTSTAAPEATTEATVAAGVTATNDAVPIIGEDTYLTLRGDAAGRPIQLSLWRTDVGLLGNYVDLQARASTGLETTTWVTGTLDDTGKLSLRNADYDAPGDNPPVVVTGTLATDSNGAVMFDGTWSEGREIADQPVRLAEVRPDTMDYTLTSNTVAERDDAHNANYTVTYPVLEGAGAAGDAFNQRAAALINQSLNAFKTDINAITETVDVNDPASQSFMQIRYELASANDCFISVHFESSFYYARAAHPNTVSFALTYDLANNREVELQDLFKPDSDYLGFLSRYSLEKLRTRPEMEIFEDGAAPKTENFRSWTVDQDGLTIVFDAYNVAAYVYGPQVVFIPFGQMRDLLASDSVIAPQS